MDNQYKENKDQLNLCMFVLTTVWDVAFNFISLAWLWKDFRLKLLIYWHLREPESVVTFQTKMTDCFSAFLWNAFLTFFVEQPSTYNLQCYNLQFSKCCGNSFVNPDIEKNSHVDLL